jgi:hypothetical protein
MINLDSKGGRSFLELAPLTLPFVLVPLGRARLRPSLRALPKSRSGGVTLDALMLILSGKNFLNCGPWNQGLMGIIAALSHPRKQVPRRKREVVGFFVPIDDRLGYDGKTLGRTAFCTSRVRWEDDP